MINVKKFVSPYSRWMDPNENGTNWAENLPRFRRPIFDSLIDDLENLDQMISITGPRRVGKSTLLLQTVKHLLEVQQVAPEKIIYYSFDDPALFRKDFTGDDVMESLFEYACETEGTTYLFLDEIHALERWELYLKKYYDLRYPTKVVVSGSASSPIFKRSRESLMGRIKDYHLLPFSFLEFSMYRNQGNERILNELRAINDKGNELKGMYARDPDQFGTESVSIPSPSNELWQHSEGDMSIYLVDGGFPEVWSIPTADKKMDYLFDNQVKKVIYEDLVLATEFRKPEQLKTFYISLLEQPGREVNLTKLSQEIGINRQQIEKYLPLLEMTDLLAYAGKFRKSALRQRKGNRKYYLVDLALRNAVLRIGKELLKKDIAMGLYAENLVFNTLRNWKGVIQIDYFREQNHEVDFVVHVRPSWYLLVEVKYRNKFARNSVDAVWYFKERYKAHAPIVVTKSRSDFGLKHSQKGSMFYIPLPLFLYLFG